MQFKQYPSYKDSGVKWLGDVPEHWQIVRTKDIFNHRKEEALEDDEIVTAFRDGQVTLRKNRRTDGFTNSIKEHGYQHINSGDLVIHEMDAFAGAIGVSDSSGKSTPVYTVCYAKNENINHHFYSHFFRTMAKTGFINSLAKGIRVRSTEFRWNESRNVYLVEPPKSDQQKIVAFLDTETTRIDNLISKQEKLIELLEEQRKSIISHAVTKGLNPNAPMKDSGVEWLGDVPEHWEVTFIKYITKKISSGKTPLGGSEVYTDEGVIFLRSQNIYNDGLHLDDVSFIPYDIHASMKSSSVKKNDVLLNITGGSIGRTCLVDREIGEANVNQHVCIIRASKAEYSKWISVFMKSNSAQSQIYYSQTGAGREGLNFSQIGNMRLPFPSLAEQQEILNFIEAENLRFETLISKQQSLIEKLKEYRASIISHAVTGKIDVREFGA